MVGKDKVQPLAKQYNSAAYGNRISSEVGK